jgi:hypothetical protein
MADDARELARRAADTMEQALDADRPSTLPTPLEEQYRAGVRMAREAADSSTSDAGVKACIEGALSQFNDPGRPIFMPVSVRQAAESARMSLDRARKSL